MKKLVVILLSSGLILGLTACGGSTGKNVAANTETTETQLDADDIQAQILELSNKENDIIAEHQDLWDTVFNNVDKEEVNLYQCKEKYFLKFQYTFCFVNRIQKTFA